MTTVYLSELTGSRLVGQSGATQTLSDLAINPDPAIGLEADDAEEAIDELASDTNSLKQIIYGGTNTPRLVIHTTTDW